MHASRVNIDLRFNCNQINFCRSVNSYIEYIDTHTSYGQIPSSRNRSYYINGIHIHFACYTYTSLITACFPFNENTVTSVFGQASVVQTHYTHACARWVDITPFSKYIRYTFIQRRPCGRQHPVDPTRTPYFTRTLQRAVNGIITRCSSHTHTYR